MMSICTVKEGCWGVQKASKAILERRVIELD